MLGDPGTTILRTTSPSVDVIVVDGTAKLKLYDTTITKGYGGAGINGLYSHIGSLEVQRCTVIDNSAGIIYDGTGAFTLNRSRVSENIITGGVSITNNIKFDITNNFIVRNGNDSNGSFGGLSIKNGIAGNARLEFNTIVDNETTNGVGKAGGLLCDFPFNAPNNIIARNTSITNPNVGGICTTNGSLVQADFAGLLFTIPDVQPYDYHLKLGSGGIDASTGGAALTTDFDGQPRPNGTTRDLGADEFYP